jgi:hypothetical protein
MGEQPLVWLLMGIVALVKLKIGAYQGPFQPTRACAGRLHSGNGS